MCFQIRTQIFSVPPNCQFQIDDAEQDWTFGINSFDFIHCRDMYTGIRDWKKFVRQCFDHLKPGGYVEFSSIYAYPKSDDGTLPENSSITEFPKLFDEITRRMGADPDFPTKFKGWFEEVGFEGVVEQTFKIPSSPWPKDPRLKRVGALELMNVVEGASGILHRGWTKEFGQTSEELEVIIAEMRKELMTNKAHCYILL